MTSPPDDRMTELRDLFFESAGELVQNAERAGLLLEKSPGDAEIIRSLRRTVHTLKGDAAACGFQRTQRTGPRIRRCADAGKSRSHSALVPDVALRAADVFTALLEAYRRKKKLPNIEPCAPRSRAWPIRRRRTGREEDRRKRAAAGGCTGRNMSRLAIAKAVGRRQACLSRAGATRSAVRHAHRRPPDDQSRALPALGEVLAIYPSDEARRESGGDRARLGQIRRTDSQQVPYSDDCAERAGHALQGKAPSGTRFDRLHPAE